MDNNFLHCLYFKKFGERSFHHRFDSFLFPLNVCSTCAVHSIAVYSVVVTTLSFIKKSEQTKKRLRKSSGFLKFGNTAKAHGMFVKAKKCIHTSRSISDRADSGQEGRAKIFPSSRGFPTPFSPSYKSRQVMLNTSLPLNKVNWKFFCTQELVI